MKILFPIISALFIFGCASYKDHSKTNSNHDSYYHDSYYRSIDMSKPVYVRGYFRKNGSYVRPHTRSYRRR